MLQRHLNRLNALASAANLKKDYALQAKYNELHGFLSHFEKGKNKAKVKDFEPILKGAIRHIISNPTLSPEDIENTIKALQTAWELKMKIATGRVQAGKKQVRDKFFQWAWKQKRAIANGAQISLENIMALNETMTDLLVDAYGKDRNTLPKFELPKPQAQPGQQAKTQDSSGWMGIFNKLFESLSTPDGIVNFIVPLIGQVIDSIFSLFGGKGKAHPSYYFLRKTKDLL